MRRNGAELSGQEGGKLKKPNRQEQGKAKRYPDLKPVDLIVVADYSRVEHKHEQCWSPESTRMELSTEEWDALSRVTQTLRSRFGAREIILYGSAARGQLDEESDIDLLVVLPRLDWEMQKQIIKACFEVELQCDRVFSATCYSTEEIEHSPLRSSPLVLAARKEGRIL